MNNERALLFHVSNHHTESCGAPPTVDGDAPSFYHSYFENEHGEQAIFAFDRDNNKGTVILGDAGWDEGYPVEDGHAVGLVLTPTEQFWLVVCWAAATRRQNVATVFHAAMEKKKAEIKRIEAAMEDETEASE